MKLLIADDEPAIPLTLKAWAEEWGYDVVTANDGREAMCLLDAPDPPRIALLDWVMPELDGLEICRRLEAREGEKGPYIILLTARRERGDKIAALDAGAHDFLTKPVDPAELKSSLAVGARILNYEKALIEKNRQILQAQKWESLGILAGGVAHDFNNLLAAIIGNANLALYDAEAGLPVSESLRQILQSASRAADLAAQMLAYAGKGRFSVRNVDVAGLVASMAPLLESSLGDEVRLEVDVTPDLPMLKADAEQLRQVLVNLITNAGEAIGEGKGSVTLRVTVEDHIEAYGQHGQTEDGPCEPAPGPYLRIEVDDDGGGMSPEVVERVFDPFFSTKFIGRGLGLAAVAGIVRAHRGAIRVHTRLGSGSSFRLYFPFFA